MRFLWDLLKSTFLYLCVVAGGLTLFLSVAPLFGYLPYSDRPGPGWYGRFPALGWKKFWVNGWEMLDYDFFIAIVIAQGGVIVALVIRLIEKH